jgi:hypothetical protein
MTTNMISWMDIEIEIARSRGSKISVCDYENNLAIPPHCVWPHPEIAEETPACSHLITCQNKQGQMAI